MASNDQKNARTNHRETGLFLAKDRPVKPFIRLPIFISVNVLILLATACMVILLFPYVTTVQTFEIVKEGEVAKETIIAPFTFDILKSPEILDKEHKEAMDKILLVADLDKNVQNRVHDKFRDLRTAVYLLADRTTADTFKTAIKMRLRKGLSENTIHTFTMKKNMLDIAMAAADSVLKDGILSVLLVPSESKLNELRSQYNTSFDKYLIYTKNYVSLRHDTLENTVLYSELPVKEIALETVITKLKNEWGLDESILNCMYELLFAYVSPNVTINNTETVRRRQAAAQEMLPIKGKVIKDTEIIRKHQEVTADQVEKLKSLNAAAKSRDTVRERRRVVALNTGKLLLLFVMLLFVAFYLRTYHPAIIQNPRNTMALALIIVFQIAVIRAGMLIVPRLFEGVGESSIIVPEYVIPAVIGSMLATILFNIEIGFVVSLFSAVFLGIVVYFNQPLFLVTLLGGIVAGYSTKNIRYRWDFFKAIPPVFAMYAVPVLLWHIIGYKIALMPVLQNIGLIFINAVLTTFFAMVATSVFENFFDLSTNMKLIELSDMNHPVLKRLSIEAPGTYNHSVLVGNLAESAAERIHANALLARVASYYHDIGKLEKPDYFVENSTSTDRNRHNKLSPNMSALIISSHVKEGVEIAKRYNLPRVIREAILQHHGTSTVSFFYEKALEQDPYKQVQENDFCYPGPRPQTRENAIIMLADSIEAASRSLATSSLKLLRELVKKIIRDKFMSSQLDQCDLTLKDLDQIVEGFMPVLQGIFHARIEYPST